MQPLVALLIAGCLCLGVLPAKAQDKAPNAPVTSANPAESFRSSEITFFGKLYSPLKLSVFLPYTAKIASLTAQIGHKVKRGDILATYEIPLDVRMACSLSAARPTRSGVCSRSCSQAGRGAAGCDPDRVPRLR